MSRFELEHINTLWFMTLGVTAISAGVLVYVLLLESALGAFSIREFYPTQFNDGEEPRIAILESDYTRNLRGVVPGGREDGWYDDLILTWRSYLDSSAYRPLRTWISDEMLENDNLNERYNVLILPAALALSEAQVSQVRSFMEDGGSVFASWKTGYYHPGGAVRGWGIVQSLFGIEVVSEVDRYQGAYRAYQAIYPGYVDPGFYTPINNVLSGIEEHEFAPLAGYRWMSPLGGVPPRADYARADTVTMPLRNNEGGMERQPAVSVSFFSWLGDDSGRLTPYPFSGFGMEQISILSNTPLSVGLPAGYGFYVQVYDPAVRFRVTGEGTRSVSYWTDWVRSFKTSPIEEQSSIAYGTNGAGRFVYTGFRRDAMGVGQRDADDPILMDRFFGNVMTYLRRDPRMWLRDWPAPYSGGALITGIGEDRLENLVAVGSELESIDVRGTFFVRPAQADLFRTVVEQLPEYGEVGVLDDFLEGSFLPTEVQTERFANLKSVLEDMTLQEVTAYRSMKPGQMAARTQEALSQAEYASVMVDSLERRTAPYVLRDTDPRLIQYGVTTWTDEELLAHFDDRPIDLAAVEHEIKRIRAEAGMYHFVYSSDGLGLPGNRYFIREIVTTLQEERFWLATSSEMTRWWRERRGIKIDMDRSGSSRLVLHLSNQNGELIQQVGVMVDLGRSVDGVRIRPELIGSPVPRHELTQDNSLLFIKIVSLKPQQTRLFHIDLITEDGINFISAGLGGTREQ